MNDLTDKITLVTGASRGIGQAIALKLAQQGAYVIGTATSEKGAKAISDYLAEANLNGEGVVLDVTSKESVEHLMSKLSDESRLPHILVNNGYV